MIGIFDSGVGGLSVLREIKKQRPGYSFAYIADQAHVPYGVRPIHEIQTFSVEISRWLIEQGAKLIVVACNTASGAALQHVRKVFPQIPFVGMVPALKPAAESTRTGKIAVLATEGTFHGELYITVKNQYANQVSVFQETCPGLVAQIEKGNVCHPETNLILENILRPLIKKDVDQIVLGCTHYPFVSDAIKEIVGGNITLIDPAPAIAKRVAHLLESHHILPDSVPSQRYISTDTSNTLALSIKNLLNENSQSVEFIHWNSDLTLSKS